MTARPFFWKLFLSQAALMAAVLTVWAWLFVWSIDEVRERERVGQLTAQAATIRDAIGGAFEARDLSRLREVTARFDLGEFAGQRLSLLGVDGRALVESADAAPDPEPATAPEVREALASGRGWSTRGAGPDGERMTFAAVRVGPADDPRGVVRIGAPAATLLSQTGIARRQVALAAVGGLLATALLALTLSRMWSEPIDRVARTARNISEGDLSARAEVEGSDELAQLARSLNTMRDRIGAQIDMFDRQKRTFETLLTHLHEGVVVTNADGRVALINPAAVRLLNVPLGGGPRAVDSFLGQPVERCVPQHQLQELLHHRRLAAADLPKGPHSAAAPPREGTLLSEQPSEESSHAVETRLQVENAAGAVHLLARVSDVRLPEQAGVRRLDAGRLLVLTDITQFVRTLQMKTDFVANASHELRTPLSTIRAAVETLMNMDVVEDPASTTRFITVIDRHSARLTALVEDLLDLARVESPSARFEPRVLRVREVFEELRTRFSEAARSKGVTLEIDDAGSEQRSIEAHPHLLRLALNNLVDNAVKFTDTGKRVRALCRWDPRHVTFEVIDEGCGIPEDELERVFERFYQVERARSGPERGTGLGLSIVRHAVAAMRGRVTLKSTPGKGTRATIEIPQSMTDH